VETFHLLFIFKFYFKKLSNEKTGANTLSIFIITKLYHKKKNCLEAAIFKYNSKKTAMMSEMESMR